MKDKLQIVEIYNSHDVFIASVEGYDLKVYPQRQGIKMYKSDKEVEGGETILKSRQEERKSG